MPWSRLLSFCLLSCLLLSPVRSISDGPLMWKQNLHAACVSTPTLTHDGSLLLIGCNDRHVSALYTSNGTIAWRRELRGRVQVRLVNSKAILTYHLP